MRILLLITFLLIVNCKFNKVVDNHGVHYLDKKQQSLTINKSNKNDIIFKVASIFSPHASSGCESSG